MKKTAVIYWSGTGNTEAMANAVAEGMREAGAECAVWTPADVGADAVKELDAAALGCPAMGAEELEETEFAPMFDAVKSALAGKPVGLCRANELYYVTTSGGPFDGRFGYDYWKTIAQDCFGIPTVKLLEAENLDIVGADAEKIVDDAIKACGPA